MQSGPQRHSKLRELEIGPAVELRVSGADATPASDISSAGDVTAESDIAIDSEQHFTPGSDNADRPTFVIPSSTDRSWTMSPHKLNWERRYKQPFNIAYFTVSTAAIATVCITKDLPILGIVAFGFALFALAAFRSAWSGRVHPNDFAISLSKRTRATLRAAALVVPIPFMAIVLAQPLAYEQMKEGGRLFSQEKNKEALAHLNLATFLNPQLQHAYSLLADCYNFTGEHDKSLANAEKALNLDPTDGGAWASKAWALNRQQKYSEALPAALNAVKYIPEGAQANHALADAYYALGEYELALPPATKHAQIHYREPGALLLQADILEKLNRPNEAAEARAAAAAINNQ